MICRLRLLLVLARPAALVLFALSAALGVAEAGQAENRLLLGEVFAAVLAFVLCNVAVNDLADERIDRVNLAGDVRRPLVAGTATRRELIAIAVSAGLVAIAVSGLLGVAPLVVMVAGLVLGIGYSVPPVRLAGRGAIASLVLPACYLGVPYLVGYTAAAGVPGLRGCLVLGGLYLGFVGRLLLKDFRDVRGDALFGKRTFLVRRGRAATCRASAVAWFAGTAVLTVVDHPCFDLTAFALTGATFVLLRRLARDGGPRRDERLIAAIAVLGRGLLLNLLAQLGLQQAHWSLAAQALLLAALTVATGGAAVSMLRHGPRSGIALRGSGRMAGWRSDRASCASSGVPTPASRP
jgi:4-hydroxybenzoate polyprenyltransferase